MKMQNCVHLKDAELRRRNYFEEWNKDIGNVVNYNCHFPSGIIFNCRK